MDFLFIVVFITILFIFIHIKHQHKVNDNDEYVITQIDTKSQLEELCDNRLPTKFPNTSLTELLGIQLQLIQSEYSNDRIDLNVGNISYEKENDVDTLTFKEFVPLDIGNVIELFSNEDTFITEKNHSLASILLDTQVSKMDKFFKPPLNVKRTYDILAGSVHATTYLQHYIYTRNFLFITSGKVRIRFVNPKYKHVFTPDYDYSNYIFKYKENIWTSKENTKWSKYVFREIEAQEGDVIFIPPFWLYSIEYVKQDTCGVLLQYQQMMNIFSNVKEHMLHMFQKSNTHVISHK